MATRKNRDLESAPVRRPPDKHALKITLLRFVDPEMDLCQGPGKDQRHRRRKTHDCQLQRCENIDEFAQHVFQNRTDSMNFTKVAFSFSTAAFGPVALKNQTRPSWRAHAAIVRAFAPTMSVVEKVVSALFSGVTWEVTAFASTGARPSCPRQRLMLSASLPPSPGKVTTEMSILSPFSANALKLA